MRRDYKKWAAGLIRGRVLFETPMRQFTSMKVGGPADSLLFPKDVDELRRVVRHARRKRIPLLILGNGTNLIVRDKGVRDGSSVWLRDEKDRYRWEVIEAEAGLPFSGCFSFPFERG